MTSTDPVLQLTGPGRPVRDRRRGHPRHPDAGLQAAHDVAARAHGRERARAPTSNGSCKANERYTFGEHDRRARVLAAKLTELGVERGDRVALVSANLPEWVITWWACAIIGRRPRSAERVVEDRGARVRSRRLGRQGVDRGRQAVRDDPRAVAGDPRAAARVRHRRRRTRRAGPSVRRAHRGSG